jgi:hypothetical protein
MTKLVYLVPLFPLIGFLANGLGRKSLSKSLIGIIGSGVILASFAISLGIFFEVKQEGFTAVTVNLFDFIKVPQFNIPFAFLVDRLSSLFLPDNYGSRIPHSCLLYCLYEGGGNATLRPLLLIPQPFCILHVAVGPRR